MRYDYQKHNEKVKILQEEVRLGKPSRMMMSLAANPRMILSDPNYNTDAIPFENYMKSPELMLETQCRFQELSANSFFCDKIMGFENIEGLSVYPDFQNVLEAEYFGCKVAYHSIYEPGTRTFLTEETRNAFIDRPFPDAMSGLMGHAAYLYEYFNEQVKNGYTYKGKPLTSSNISGLNTDGPFTIACCILGATEACLAIYEDESFIKAFLEYITEATIYRIKTARKFYGLPEKSDDFFMADDSIAMLSIDSYNQFILPLHKKLYTELSTGEKGCTIHLCGDATRFFPILVKELNAKAFDTGFPVSHAELVKTLGSDINIYGGVHVQLLENGSLDNIRAETLRIINEVKPLTKNFIIKEANNLAPGTPPQNLLAMYETVLEYGVYE